MTLQKLRYKEDGYCEVCLQHKPTMGIDVVIAVGWENGEEEIEVCKECFEFNWEMSKK